MECDMSDEKLTLNDIAALIVQIEPDDLADLVSLCAKSTQCHRRVLPNHRPKAYCRSRKKNRRDDGENRLTHPVSLMI